MIESCEQTGHRRRITSALPSAQSIFSLLCAAESGIKTIVQKRLCPGYSDRRKIFPRAEPSPLSKISPGKEYRILRPASYLHHQPPYIGRLSSPGCIRTPVHDFVGRSAPENVTGMRSNPIRVVLIGVRGLAGPVRTAHPWRMPLALGLSATSVLCRGP